MKNTVKLLWGSKMKKEKFKLEFMKSNLFKPPKGFIEEDIRGYACCGDSQIEDLLNSVLMNFQKDKYYLIVPESPDVKVFTSETADLLAMIEDTEDETEVSVWKLHRRWIKEKVK
jgi:hypothetical protein